MRQNDSSPCCGAGNCDPAETDRRTFLALGGAVAADALFPDSAAVAGPFDLAEFEKLVPADKKFRPEWLAALTARGTPETYTGDDLKYIGMPVGGICTGTLYLGGDGRLWLWDVFNRPSVGVRPTPAEYHGQQIDAIGGSAYVAPPAQIRPVDQGLAVRVKTADGGRVRPLDRTGFRDVTFRGQYPIGTVTYRDADSPVSVALEAYSPFIPLNADDSGLPATVLTVTVTNTSGGAVEADLVGWLENAVCTHHRDYPGVRRNRVRVAPGSTALECTAAGPPEPPAKARRADVVFEDWAKDGYDGWAVEGTAFGAGPVATADIPKYQGEVGGLGRRVVNSHAAAPGKDVAEKDAKTGSLTSRPFTVSRDFVNIWVGGGSHAGKTCVEVLVGGKVVRSVTGKAANRMAVEAVDVRAWAGKEAALRIVDAATGAWGNVGVGRITFSDTPEGRAPLEALPDFGTMALAVLGPAADVRTASGGAAGQPGEAAEAGLAEKLVGAVGRTVKLAPGAAATVTFVVAWHFPNLTIGGALKGRHYATKFADAPAVVRYVAEHFARLSAATRLWRDTWYDSTLPHWFLNRTFANTSTLATSTCHRLRDGRFWAWEGVGCCPGTCTHVWHYAHAIARVFPELERDLREHVDFGLALDPKTGLIRFRAEFGNTFAVDGQCGTILRAYREHQTAADGGFLRRTWPKIKAAMRCVLARDRDRSGVLYGPMHNTLDADWYGVVPWVVGLYHAALRAAEEMAGEAGDAAFARECRAVFTAGVPALDRLTWREDHGYFIHLPDPKHATEVGAYDGCHVDQVFGQSWAWQVGLGRVADPDHVRRALKALWTYSVAPDVGPFRAANRPGRWYALPGDGGLLMVTFPFGRPKAVSGPGAWSAMYFNECMSGFEWQAAGHMLWEGLVTEGLAVARLVHDRYNARHRNPYNEVECSDHYARAMASYGAFLAACGFEYHGPMGHIGFAPRLTPDDFRAPFTAAEGWGTYSQKRTADRLEAAVAVKHGRVRLKTMAVELPEGAAAAAATVELAGHAVEATRVQTGRRTVVTFAREVRVEPGSDLRVAVALEPKK